MGGYKRFCTGGMNLRVLGRCIEMDGKTSKYMPYNDPVYGTGKFRLVAQHPAGTNRTLGIKLNLFVDED